MDQRKQFIADFHPGLQSVTELAERFVISRKTAYKWVNCCEEDGASALSDRSRRPQSLVAFRLSSTAGGEMTNVEFVLSLDQREEILKAAKAIGRQVKEMVGKPDWQALYVIGTNLTIIQTNLTNLPRASSN